MGPFENLPAEIITLVLSFLTDRKDIQNASLVSNIFASILQEARFILIFNAQEKEYQSLIKSRRRQPKTWEKSQLPPEQLTFMTLMKRENILIKGAKPNASDKAKCGIRFYFHLQSARQLVFSFATFPNSTIQTRKELSVLDTVNLRHLPLAFSDAYKKLRDPQILEVLGVHVSELNMTLLQGYIMRKDFSLFKIYFYLQGPTQIKLFNSIIEFVLCTPQLLENLLTVTHRQFGDDDFATLINVLAKNNLYLPPAELSAILCEPLSHDLSKKDTLFWNRLLCALLLHHLSQADNRFSSQVLSLINTLSQDSIEGSFFQSLHQMMQPHVQNQSPQARQFFVGLNNISSKTLWLKSLASSLCHRSFNWLIHFLEQEDKCALIQMMESIPCSQFNTSFYHKTLFPHILQPFINKQDFSFLQKMLQAIAQKLAANNPGIAKLHALEQLPPPLSAQSSHNFPENQTMTEIHLLSDQIKIYLTAQETKHHQSITPYYEGRRFVTNTLLPDSAERNPKEKKYRIL